VQSKRHKASAVIPSDYTSFFLCNRALTCQRLPNTHNHHTVVHILEQTHVCTVLQGTMQSHSAPQGTWDIYRMRASPHILSAFLHSRQYIRPRRPCQAGSALRQEELWGKQDRGESLRTERLVWAWGGRAVRSWALGLGSVWGMVM
jgi:hypothetical protein